jgi:uncharacterized tellurite resistance protein B-like protein
MNNLLIKINRKEKNMADWQALLKEAILADGVIDADETALLKKEILADGVVDQEEVDFLVDLRNRAKSTSPEFDEFFFSALKMNILADGVIDADEAHKLREIIFADGVVDAAEKKFLKDLKESAGKTSPEFEALYKECMK